MKITLCCLVLFLSGCVGASVWPTTSNNPVPVQQHPTLAESLARQKIDGSAPYRLVVFGDQRALADGEFQALVRAIAQREATLSGAPPLAAIIDTGDIVDSGKHSDQFAMLRDVLEPVRQWPYLVAVGNHELDQDLEDQGRRNFAAFMGEVPGPLFNDKRLWYRLDAPGLRLIFLDTNQWVYRRDESLPEHRREQLAWLSAQMAEEFDGVTILTMHHPLVISNEKHRAMAAQLWSLKWNEELLASMIARGTDLVLTGHTHTFERYRLQAPTGDSFHLLNVSGRPRDGFLWWGDGSRRAHDIKGREVESLVRAGWRREELAGWTVQQLDAMADKDTEEDQWAEITVHPDGRIQVEMFFLVDRGAGGYESRGSFVVD